MQPPTRPNPTQKHLGALVVACALLLPACSSCSREREGALGSPGPGGDRRASTVDPGADAQRGASRRSKRPKQPRDPFVDTRSAPVSTFGIDVDTASYTRVRASLTAGVLPRRDDVRTEEMLNYFRYSYPSPRSAPFGLLVDAARSPWDPERRLVRIGIKGREVDAASRPPANIVLLIDTSGSMAGPKKMDLLKDGFATMVGRLSERDRVAIVAYAGRAGLVLGPTPGNERAKIINALDAFETGGATDGALGIQRGYEVAAESFIEGGINRVFLATDGDFNLGAKELDALSSLIARKAKTGIFLTVLGFGSFNPNDKRLETLADRGNGHYAFVDGPAEARRVLSDELGATLQTIAKDVKIQVRWDPAHVRRYRLLGYENRALSEEEFADDEKDAGDLGAGHTVTALYDIEPASQRNQEVTFGTVALRFKEPGDAASREMEAAIGGSDARFFDASTDFRFAASVAAFAMLLRGERTQTELSYAEVGRWAADARGDDASGQRAEFGRLVQRASDRWEVAKRAAGGGR